MAIKDKIKSILEPTKEEKSFSGIGATLASQGNVWSNNFGYTSLKTPSAAVYDQIRESIPVVDAAITKLERLMGGFVFETGDQNATDELNRYARTVRVGATGRGVESFVTAYLDSLIVYGTAVGEIIMPAQAGDAPALYNASFERLAIKPSADNPSEYGLYVSDGTGLNFREIKNKEGILFSALNPKPNEVVGQSVLKSLPAVAEVFAKMLSCMGQNFDRAGNVRFAVTYNPGSEDERAFASENAKILADNWAAGMQSTKSGNPTDFVAVGDVRIKAIGADNQVIDYEVPTRILLEQIIAKLGIPPFMLGISWATTERMSYQQAKVLSNELAYYRRILNPIIEKIGETYLENAGYQGLNASVVWDVLNFDDEIDAANVRLIRAQAQKLEIESAGEESPVTVDVSH